MQLLHLRIVPRNTRQYLPSQKDLLGHKGISTVDLPMTVQCTVQDVEVAAVVAQITMVVAAEEEAVVSTMIGIHRSTAICLHFYACKMFPFHSPHA